MIVAVTGANGFIGRHLCARFAAGGVDVRPIVRADYEKATLEDRLRDVNVVIHAAAATRAPTVAELRQSNVGLTERTLHAATRARVDRFVFVSSQAAAGPASARDQPVHEDLPATPVEPYGRSKFDAEALVRAAGIAWTIVRPAAVYGPGDRDFLALFRLARGGIALHPGNRDHWLSIAHVSDVADGIVAAATSAGAARRTYFLGGDARQWRDLYVLAATTAGSRLRADVELPFSLVNIAASFGDAAAILRGRAGLLTSGKVALSRPKYWLCSSDRAMRELGYSPRVALPDGFRDTYAWYRKEGWL
ncbi:MAG TPA: NAD-dependent epimerase/dehydratase family protein [Gemmatimonadaceae bacterium]|jgi:nucleoside-diphosphate-sugar epimerase|nr:NAD-dependent epimerase/dehydratase family protein [Gemmatimonadaceae bacterium]